MFCGVLVVFMMVGVDNALNLHMNTYFWELKSKGNLMFFMATPIGALIGTLFARKFTEKFDKKPSILIGTSCWAICQVLPIVLRFMGMMPENGTSELLSVLITIKLIQGFGVVQALVVFNSMVADVVDQHELQTRLRQEGIFFSAISFSNKVTSGVGTVAAGLALALIDWPTGITVQSASDIAPVTIEWLGWIYGPIVSGFAIVSVYCYSKYDITRESHKEIVVKLRAMRAQ
jgi:Na+/melibiose symporter-like transporter